jgi:hypothetical protein
LLTVKIINANTRDFVRKVFDIDFFEGDVLIYLLGLLEQISTALLDGFLLRSVVNDVISDFFGLGMEGHDRFLENVLLLLDISLLQVHLLGLILRLGDGVLEHHELFSESFGLIFYVLRSLIQEVLIGLHFLEHPGKILRDLLLFLGFIAHTRDL